MHAVGQFCKLHLTPQFYLRHALPACKACLARIQLQEWLLQSTPARRPVTQVTYLWVAEFLIDWQRSAYFEGEAFSLICGGCRHSGNCWDVLLLGQYAL